MSTVYPITVRCAVCGSENTYHVLGSTNQFGSPDLDLRPPEMMRSTMHLWVQECPDCGYVARDVSEPAVISRDYLLSEDYLTCECNDFLSPLAERFYRRYLIALREGNGKIAFSAILQAAWACDDADDTDKAVHCRRIALDLAAGVIDAEPDNADTMQVLRADLLRRAGMFDELRKQYADVRFDNGLLNRIVAFQLALAERGDTGCYTVADVPD